MKTETQMAVNSSGSLLDQYLVIQVADTRYAIKLEPIREIVIVPKVTPVPESRDFIRGVIKLRKNIITLIDTRKRLGKQSLEEMDKALLDMLKQREAEHIEWVQTLITSIEKDTEFTLTTDPHACNFGKWYDSYKTDNIGLSIYLKQFDLPHKRVHGVATRAIHEKKMNGAEAALKVIDDVRERELKQLQLLFDGMQDTVRESHRELAIVIERNESLIAITADNVSNIFNFDEESLQQSEMKDSNQFVSGSVNHNDEVFLLLDLDKLVDY